MGILCAGPHGKAQCRDPGLCRSSWEGSVEGDRGVQGLMGRLGGGRQGCAGQLGKAQRRDPGVCPASGEHLEGYLSWVAAKWPQFYGKSRTTPFWFPHSFLLTEETGRKRGVSPGLTLSYTFSFLNIKVAYDPLLENNS